MLCLLPPIYILTNPVVNGVIKAPTIEASTLDGQQEISSGTSGIAQTLPSGNDLKSYLREQASLYGVDYDEMSAVIQCESGWRVDPPHNNISWGIAQFTPDTWTDFGSGDIMNPYTQLDVMAKMWSKGLHGRWDCYKIVFVLPI